MNDGDGGFISSGGGFRRPRPAPLAFNGYRQLAAAVLADSVTILRKPVKNERGEAKRAFEINFFRDAKRAAKWCEMAGFDYAAVLSKLEASGLMPDGMTIEEAERVLAQPVAATPPEARHGALTVKARAEAKDALRDALLRNLPPTRARACTTREIAESLGTYRLRVVTILHQLEAEGIAASYTSNNRRGGAAVIWWRVEP